MHSYRGYASVEEDLAHGVVDGPGTEVTEASVGTSLPRPVGVTIRAGPPHLPVGRGAVHCGFIRISA